jgi:hypothetical protein
MLPLKKNVLNTFFQVAIFSEKSFPPGIVL